MIEFKVNIAIGTGGAPTQKDQLEADAAHTFSASPQSTYPGYPYNGVTVA
jgi:hypothetical protein